METMQIQALAELQKYSLKVRTMKMYWGKFYIEFYHFCQQCEDYFKTSRATRMNQIPFAISFLHDSINLRWV